MESISRETERVGDLYTLKTTDLVVVPVSISRQFVKDKTRVAEYRDKLSDLALAVLSSDISEVFTREFYDLVTGVLDPDHNEIRLNVRVYVDVFLTPVKARSNKDMIVYLTARVLGKGLEEEDAPIERVVTYFVGDLLDSPVTKRYPKGVLSDQVNELIGWINGSFSTTCLESAYISGKGAVVNTSSVDAGDFTITSFKEQMKITPDRI